MDIYDIFDDFGDEPRRILMNAGVNVVIHPKGKRRPDSKEMIKILENFDGIIIGTSQKITEDMFDNIVTPKIIATASVGIDHIKVPEEKCSLVTIINTPKANAKSVAEYTIGCALICYKRIFEGKQLYLEGKNNKNLHKKPEDLNGKVLGVVGAGNISQEIIKYGLFFGMEVICWTAHPEKHRDLEDSGVVFSKLDDLFRVSDVISVNLPNVPETIGIVSADRIQLMKEECVFISISRIDTIDYSMLFRRADNAENFYVCLDVDVDDGVVEQLKNRPNIMVTPHIAGGTVETRKRMFKEVANKIVEYVNKNQ